MYGLVPSISSNLATGPVEVPRGKLTDKFARKPLVFLSILCFPLAFLLMFSRSFLDFSLIVGYISVVGNLSSQQYQRG
jgi:hypothetical protein